MRLSHHDILRVNEAIVLLYRMASTMGPLNAIAAVLPGAVGGILSFVDLSGKTRKGFALSEPVKLPCPVEHRKEMMEHPRAQFAPTGEVAKISDYLSQAQWHRRDLYNLMLPYAKPEDDMGVDIALADGGILRACVMRDTRTFREEDREIFSLLLPHIVSLVTPSTDQTPTLTGMGLTRREQEVLLWVSEGKTNAEIASILHIAPGTVKIHLEHIYEKLGVVNRHGAARRALEALHPERFTKSGPLA